jgi:dCMP deaminase
VSSKAKKNSQILVTYVPVIHEGYRRFFRRFPDVTELWLIGRELAYELRALQKDVRALEPAQVKRLLAAWPQFKTIEILTPKTLRSLRQAKNQLVFANDAISRHLVKKYFADNRVLFADVFLMWDEKSSLKRNELKDYSKISNNKFNQKMMVLAFDEASKSDDWWRHVGGVIFKDKKVLLKTHNKHVPIEYEAYYEGDPRANFHQGEYYKISTAIHVEAYLIAQAAKLGISLADADLYVNTFPCPVCAKQVAYSGIKRLYFREGYSVLDGEKVLKANGVELIKVS